MTNIPEKLFVFLLSVPASSSHFSSVRVRVQRPGMPKGGKSGDATCDEATCERVVSLLRMPRIFDIERDLPRFSQQRFVLHKNLHLTKLGKYL